jgi:hypothetical protein
MSQSPSLSWALSIFWLIASLLWWFDIGARALAGDAPPATDVFCAACSTVLSSASIYSKLRGLK